MIVHDYPAKKRRTFEDIERLALDFRNKWGISKELKVDVFKLLFSAMPTSLKETGLTLVARQPGFMGEREAYAASKSKRIFYRDRLLAQLRFGHPIASITFLHELAHFLLHPGDEKAWLTDGNKKPCFLADEESTEWQATTFALCVMAPRNLSRDCSSPDELAERFGLDAKHALQYFDQICRRRVRKIPDSYYNVKAELKGSSVSKSTFLSDLCSECGAEQLIPIDTKYWCGKCNKLSDKFQDGDFIGFEF